MTELAAIILAAGKGTRMKSDLHKVLHPIACRPMLMHLMASVDALRPTKKVVVVGSGKEQLEAALAGAAQLALQEPQFGTGHAVQQAQGACVPVQAWRSPGAREVADVYDDLLDMLLTKAAETVADLGVSSTMTFSTGTESS